MKHRVNNIEFSYSLVVAIASLLASGIILSLAYVWLNHRAIDDQPLADRAQTTEMLLKGDQFSIKFGYGGRAKDETITVSNLAREGRAVVATEVDFRALEFPFIHVNITGAHMGEILYLFWRTMEDPSEISMARLSLVSHNSTTLYMEKNQNWKGVITEIGLIILGDMRNKPLHLKSLSFLPYEYRNLFSATWSEWAGYSGWSQSSINHLKGAAEDSTAPLTAALAIWAALALLIVFCMKSKSVDCQFASCICVILIPWVAFDLMWQSKLEIQLHETQLQFLKKTTHERHLADIDSGVYQYAMRLKTQILEDEVNRIFILSAKKGHEYNRLKTQYYLLPNNVYNFGEYPPDEGVRIGDYVLALGESPRLNFIPNKGRLVWGNGNWLPVKMIDKEPLGTLYRVSALPGTHQPSAVDAPDAKR